MGIIDKVISAISPERALKRAKARYQLNGIERLYDVAQPSNFHTKPRDNRSADGVIDHSRSSLRDFARHLDENHDIAIGVLDTLVDNIVGRGDDKGKILDGVGIVADPGKGSDVRQLVPPGGKGSMYKIT